MLLNSRMASGDRRAEWCGCDVHNMCTTVSSCSFFSYKKIIKNISQIKCNEGAYWFI